LIWRAVRNQSCSSCTTSFRRRFIGSVWVHRGTRGPLQRPPICLLTLPGLLPASFFIELEKNHSEKKINFFLLREFEVTNNRDLKHSNGYVRIIFIKGFASRAASYFSCEALECEIKRDSKWNGIIVYNILGMSENRIMNLDRITIRGFYNWKIINLK